MRGIWILLSAAVLLQTGSSSPVGPPTIEYMDGAAAAKVVFDENVSEVVKSGDVASNSTNTEVATDSPASASESEAETMIESNDEAEESNPTTISPMAPNNELEDEVVTSSPELSSAADEPQSDSDADSIPTTTSSIDMS